MSKFTSIALGIALLTTTGLAAYESVRQSAPSGSQIITGNQYFITDPNTTLNPGLYVNSIKLLTFTGSATTKNAIGFDSTYSQPACFKYGTRHVDCYQQVTLTAGTGACVAAGCTGASGKSYHVASITKPYTGSGVIRRVEITCDGHAPSSTLYAAQVATSSTISGTNIFGVKTVGSGAVLVNSTGSIVWSKSTPDIRVYTGKKITQTECLLAVWSDEVNNP